MKKRNLINVKKGFAAIFAAAFVTGMLMGCGNKAVDENNTAVPAEELQEETVETKADVEETAAEKTEEAVESPFLANLERYDKIISTLTKEQYYAFASVGDDDVLLVADGAYDNLDGNMATIDARVYAFGNDGGLYEAGNVWSNGTAYPLAVYENYIMFGGNHNMAMATVKDGSVVIVREAYEEFDSQGNATYTYNDGDIDNVIEVEDDSVLAEMYEKYAQATVINFTQGEAAAVSDAEMVDAPSNALEERVGKTSFESYDEIIGLLEEEEGYALVNVKGYDGQVLLVTSYVYDDLLGHMATTECTPYTVKSNGVCTADSALTCGGTATPVKMDKEGVFYTANHVSVEKSCYGDNGTDDTAIMILAAISAEDFDDNGMPKTVSGFVRTKNSLIDDDCRFIEENEVELWGDFFEEYEKAEAVSFTKISK